MLVHELFERFCPTWHFHSSEQTFPCTFKDLLTICELHNTSGEIKASQPTENDAKNAVDGDLLVINFQKRNTLPMGTQVWCLTDGLYTFAHEPHKQWIDLHYTVIFSWNDTVRGHAFDSEYVVIRVNVTDDIILAAFGSVHGNGIWTKNLTFQEPRSVNVYSSLNSHAMYFNAKLYKRLFGFGNDVTDDSGKIWKPTEFIMCPTQYQSPWADGAAFEAPVMYRGNTRTNTDVSAIYYKGRIGNYDEKQYLATREQWQSQALDTFYKYQGGITNLFNHPDLQIVPTWLSILVTVFAMLAYASLLAYYTSTYVWGKTSKPILVVWKIFLAAMILFLFFLISFFAGLYLFVI